MSTQETRLAAARKFVKSQAFASLKSSLGTLGDDLGPGIPIAAHVRAIEMGMAGLEASVEAATPSKAAPGWPAIDLGTPS